MRSITAASASIMGHEMTHGFDDQGAQFDADGNLKNWWTPEDLKNFHERGDCIVKEFDSFEVEPGLHENGKLEEGEAIADLGGLVIAHAAFEKTLEGSPRRLRSTASRPNNASFSATRQNWAVNYRPEAERLRAKTDPHPLNFFRVDGTVRTCPHSRKRGVAPRSRRWSGRRRCAAASGSAPGRSYFFFGARMCSIWLRWLMSWPAIMRAMCADGFLAALGMHSVLLPLFGCERLEQRQIVFAQGAKTRERLAWVALPVAHCRGPRVLVVTLQRSFPERRGSCGCGSR